MKKPLLLAVNLLMMTSLLGDCTLTKVEKEVIPKTGNVAFEQAQQFSLLIMRKMGKIS